jgi:hypothetical protein
MGHSSQHRLTAASINNLTRQNVHVTRPTAQPAGRNCLIVRPF